MIKELSGKRDFFQDDPLLLKYFLYKIPTDNEKEKAHDLYQLIDDFYSKVYSEKTPQLDISYLDNFGYYELKYVDRGWYYLRELGEDVHAVAIKVIKDILVRNGYELINGKEARKELKREYKERFKRDDTYSHLFYIVEYAIKKWNIYYDGAIPTPLVKEYENYINDLYQEEGLTWEYNKDSKKLLIKK